LDFRGKKLCEGRKNKTLFKGIYSFFVIVVIEFLKRLVVCLLLVFFLERCLSHLHHITENQKLPNLFGLYTCLIFPVVLFKN